MKTILKNILVALALSVTAVLGGCATDPNGNPVVTNPDYSELIAQVQSYCKVACGFVPTASTVLNIITGGNPGVIAATSISQAICAALFPPPALARKGFTARSIKGWRVTPGAVNGVVIEGQRVH